MKYPKEKMNENERLCFVRGYELGVQACIKSLINMNNSVKKQIGKQTGRN